MERDTLKTALAATWTVAGMVQAVLAAASGLPALAVLGTLFALLGAGYYWTEVYRPAEP